MPTNSEFGEIEWNLVEFRVWGIQEAETVRFELRLVAGGRALTRFRSAIKIGFELLI